MGTLNIQIKCLLNTHLFFLCQKKNKFVRKSLTLNENKNKFPISRQKFIGN